MRQIARQTTGGYARRRTVITAIALGVLSACSPDSLIGNAPLPSDLSDPAALHTRAGALAAYNGAVAQFRAAFSVNGQAYVTVAAELSDELQNGQGLGDPLGAATDPVDSRTMPEYSNPAVELNTAYMQVYAALQKVRGHAAEALGLLRDYAPDASPALRGHLYALEGYSEVMMAELYCSGIPLSTVDYDGDFTLKAGSSTEDVLLHAVALFDTASTLSADSVRFLDLAQVGKGRALLGLGRYGDAAAAVASVPDGYRYEVSYTSAEGANAANFARIDPGTSWGLNVPDRKGLNGLDYLSSGDPRTAVSMTGLNGFSAAIYHPNKYATDGSSPIVLADAVEARLIEAEAALNSGNVPSWLGTINRLRETAITPALTDTTDPGTPDARVDLLFRERAFWLFLTGHRQGDMRRLIRQYGRTQLLVYPTGANSGAFGRLYGNDVTAPIPALERTQNSLFTGCISRGA